MVNLSNCIKYHAANNPTSGALSFRGDITSYEQFYRRIERLAGFLLQKQIGPGDVVAVLMKNSPTFIEIAFAVSHLGGIFLPINFRLAPDEVTYICEHSDAKLLIIDDEFECSALTTDRIIVDPYCPSETSLAANSRPTKVIPRCPQDLFRLIYTSGTTSHPKGVMHTYENFYWKCSEHAIALNLGPETRLLVAGPLYHVGAFDLPGIGVLLQGGMLSIMRDFEPLEAFRLIDTEQLNAGWLAPIMTSTLLESPRREDFNLSSMKWIIGGGERTPEQRIRDFSGLFANARYIDAYGLTESGSGDTFMPPGYELKKIGSTGRATPHVQIKIAGEEGSALPVGEVGEICLRGPKIFNGYWRDKKNTRLAFKDGWFRTGDAGFLDKDNFLYITDRLKDMIISGGENIASLELERVIQQMPEVQEVAVVGIPDAKWGEMPAAVIVCKEGEAVDIGSLRKHCGEHLAAFKIPKKLVVSDSLPRNPSGKLLKRLIRQQLEP